MKKTILSFAVLVAFVAIGSIGVNPSGAQAQTACPVGFTCTPIPAQPVNCPAGYICTPTAPSSQPSIVVLSPNGGETYSSSSGINFSGRVNYAPKNLVAYLYSPVNGNVATIQLQNSSAGTFSGTFTGDPGIGAGQYKVTACDLTTDSPITPGKPLCDSSNDFFTVSSSGPSGTCYVFTTNLTLGSTGPDVTALQNWLISNGFNIPAIASGAQAKGYFGIQTQAALMKFQISIGLNQAATGKDKELGFFGPMTRAYINSHCASTNPTQPTITSISPTFGTAGTQVTIYGSGFVGGDSVLVSGKAFGQSVTPTSVLGSQMTFIMPALNVGTFTYDVQVTGGNTTSNYKEFVGTGAGQSGGCYTFTTDLQTGSTGADVVALQTWLLASGYSIPEISSGSVAKGTYDSQTATAVSAYQTAHGIPATGFVGALTRAALNACSPTPVTCPLGYVCNTPVNLVTQPVGIVTDPSGTYQVDLSFTGGTASQPVSQWSLNIACPSGVDVNASPGASCNSAFQMGTNGQNYGNVSTKAFWFKNYTGSSQTVTLTLNAYNSAGALMGTDQETLSIPVTSTGQQSWSQVTLLSPNGGGTYSPGQSVPVQWTTTSGTFQFSPSSQVVIYLERGNAVVATFNTTNTGFLNVTIPSTAPADSNYKMDVTVYAVNATPGSAMSDDSDSTFSISGSGSPVTPPYQGSLGCSISPVPVMSNSYGYSAKLFNIEFGTDAIAPKSGPALVGNPGDFWNAVSVGNCDDHNVTGMKSADGSQSSIVAELQNLGGGWGGTGLGVNDVVLQHFNYPTGNKGGNSYVTLSSVPAGMYDLYIYNKTQNAGQDGDYTLSVGGRFYGRRMETTDANSPYATTWQENNQFVKFPAIQVNKGDNVSIMIQPSSGGLRDAQIAALQLAPAGTPYVVPVTVYNGSNPVQPSLTVLSPSAGQSLQPGQQFTISWAGSNMPAGTAYTINAYNGPSASISYPNTTIASGVTGSSYSWTVSPNTGGWGLGMNPILQKIAEALGVKTANAASNQYVIQVCAFNPSGASSNVCAASGVITIGSGSQSQSPVISGLTAPTQLAVGQQGTWSVNAYDPQNGPLSYSVNWGDSGSCPPGYVCSAATPGFVQSATFTHTYANAGTYMPTFTVRNAAGLTAQTSATTQIGSTQSSVQVNLSLDPSSPVASTIPVQNATTGQYLGLPVLVFDLAAQNGPVNLTNVSVQLLQKAGQVGNIGAAYLYLGSTLVSSASVNGASGLTTFSITPGTYGATISANATSIYTVKVDISGLTAAGSSEVIQPTISSAQIVAQTSSGSIPVTGGVTGNLITVVSAGAASPVFSLSGAPTITKQVINTDQNGNSTTTYSASFNVQVQAVDGNIYLGLPNSSRPAFGFGPNGFQVFRNGSADPSTNAIVSYSQPSNTTLGSDGTSFVVSTNQTATIPVTASFVVQNPGANVYAVQIQAVDWFTSPSNPATAVVNFIANDPSWRTPMVYSGSNASYASAPAQDMSAAIWAAVGQWYATH